MMNKEEQQRELDELNRLHTAYCAAVFNAPYTVSFDPIVALELARKRVDHYREESYAYDKQWNRCMRLEIVFHDSSAYNNGIGPLFRLGRAPNTH